MDSGVNNPAGQPRLAARQYIDAICDRYEAEWLAGRAARLEDFLGLARFEQERRELASELLALELDYRSRRGDDVRMDEYLTRLGEQSLVQQVFAEFLARRADQGASPAISTSDTDIARKKPATKSEVAGLAFDAPFNLPRYTILKKVGEGAMGTVYLARDKMLDRDVALKIPKIPERQSALFIARFRREARMAAGVHHRNLCPVFDVSELNGVPYLTMAFIEGTPLDEVGELSVRATIALIRKLALALEQAHARGVVHRDIKPANIMMDTHGEPVLMDFGLARPAALETDLTQAGMIIGTPAYMSPEQAQGRGAEIDARSDIYSLGVVMFVLLTGRLPLAGDLVALLKKIVHDEPPPPSLFRDEVDVDLDEVCLRMMAKNPEDRYPSMRAVADELNDWQLRKDVLGSPPVAPPQQVAVPPGEVTNAGVTASRASTPPWGRRALLVVLPIMVAAVCVFWPDKAVQTRTPLEQTSITIEVNEPGIRVTVAEQTVTGDSSGREIRLSPGSYRLRIEREGYSFETDPFPLRKDEHLRFAIRGVGDRIEIDMNDERFGSVEVASEESVRTFLKQLQGRWGRREK